MSAESMDLSDWCWSHNTNEERPADCYIVCGECCHAFLTANELLTFHNEILTALGASPETDPKKVFSCPLCLHDF